MAAEQTRSRGPCPARTRDPFTVYDDLGSNVIKSDAPSFEPPARPMATSSTRLLWHFDECSGASAMNAVDGTRYNGALEAGASWTP